MTTFESGPAVSGPTSSFARPGIRAFAATVTIALMLASPLVLATPAAAQTGGESGTAWTTANLNLRGGPSLQGDVRTVIPAGTTVEITGAAENGFYPVTWQDLDGFAHGDYLTTANTADAPAGTGEAASAGNGVDGANGYSTGEIVQVIYNAAAIYGQSGGDLLRVAQCESGLNPNAVNGSSGASGLFQFMPGTWATTPYAGQDIFDPVANAEAAAWMWANGRRGEWSCQ